MYSINTCILARCVPVGALPCSLVDPVREATDHRPKEVDRQQRILGTHTEHMEEASVSKQCYSVSNSVSKQCLQKEKKRATSNLCSSDLGALFEQYRRRQQTSQSA